MPVDSARIQGFGCKVPEARLPAQCPKGHELQIWKARSGNCDGCNKSIDSWELVMDCRRCNWYLCNDCCSLDKLLDGSLWGAISSLPFYVLDDLSTVVNEIETLVESAVLDKPEQHFADVKTQAESARIVAEFCETYPATRVAPSKAELDALWEKCGALQAQPVADAIYDQLSFCSGDDEWQPKLRALHALEYLHLRGDKGRDITKRVFHDATDLLQHFVGVPQCSKKASQITAMLQRIEPAGAAGCSASL